MDFRDPVVIGYERASLTIRSFDRSDEAFVVSLDLPGITASRKVYLDYYDKGGGLVDFFGTLAEDWKGWDGPREWDTYEADFRLTCWHDRIGHVSIQVDLGVEPIHEWHDPMWRVTGQVICDPGHLGVIAVALGHLFEAE